MQAPVTAAQIETTETKGAIMARIKSVLSSHHYKKVLDLAKTDYPGFDFAVKGAANRVHGIQNWKVPIYMEYFLSGGDIKAMLDAHPCSA